MEGTTLVKRNHTGILLGIYEYLTGPEGQVVLDMPRFPPFLEGSKYGNTRSIHGTAMFVFVFAFVAVVLRIFCRTRVKSKLWWDDGFAISAMVFLMANQLIINMLDHLGGLKWLNLLFGGPQEAEMDPSKKHDITLALKLFVGFEAVYILSMWSVKFSMLAFYVRWLASGQNQSRYARRYLGIIAGVCGIGMVFSTFALLLSCIPMSDFWNIDEPAKQKCHKSPLFTYGTGITAIVTDGLVLLAPVPFFFRASFTLRKKLGLAVLYLHGALVVALSILRLITHVKVDSVQQTVGWAHMEETFALIAANLPLVSKLLILPLIDTPVVELRPIRKRRTTFYGNDEEAYDKDLPRVPTEEAVNGQRLSHVAYQIQDNNLFNPNDARRDLQKARRSEVVKSTVLVKEIQSPDYRNLKIVLNGQSVWEVRPVSSSDSAASRPATLYSATSRPTTSGTSVSRWSSRSSRYSVSSSRYGGRSNTDETESDRDVPEMPPIADGWKHLYLQN